MKKLNLEVIFGAKDGLSPALKHMIGGSKAAASALDKTVKQLTKLKIDQRNIESYKKFRNELDQTTGELNRYKQTISELKRQSDMGPLTKKQTRELEKSQKALERLNGAYDQQSRKLIETVQKMHQAGMSVDSLAQDESNLKDKILLTTSAYAKQKQAIERINTAQEQYQKTQNRLQTINNVAGKGILFAGASAAATTVPVKLAIDFESAMADVKKVVDFGDQPTAAAAGLKAMSDEVVRMSTYLPMAAKDIASIVAAGGQSGIAKGELTQFAEDAVKMGVAFDTTAQEAGQSMAEMRTAFRLSQNEVVTLADKINYLGNNTPAAAKSIMDIVQRIGPLGEVGGYASGSIAALGATLKGMGVQEEIAATGIKNMMLALVSGESATKSQKAVWADLGMNYVQVAKDMQTNAEDTTMKVLQSISKLDKYKQASVLKELFGSESLSAIAPLLTNMDSLQKNLSMVGDKTKYAGSMNAEYAARAATTANNLQLLKNNMSAIGITVGNILLPALNMLVENARDVLGYVQAWAKENPTLASTLVKVAVGAVALVGGVSAIALALTTIIGPLAFLKMSLVSLSGGVGLFSGLLKALILPMKMMGTVFLFVGKAMLANPMVLAITAIVAAVAGAVYLIYKNWEPIKGFFVGIWSTIKTAFNGGIKGVSALIINWSPVGLFYMAFAKVMSWFGIDLPSKFTGFGSMIIDGLIKGIKTGFEKLKGLWATINSYMPSFMQRSMDIHSPSRVMAGLGGHIMGGLRLGLQQGFPELKTKFADVLGIFNPNISGLIQKINVAPALSKIRNTHALPSGSNRGDIVIQGDTITMHIHTQPGQSVQQIAQVVNQMLSQREHQKLARARNSFMDIE